MITIAETRAFQSKAAKLLSEDERLELIAYLSSHPNAGVLIKGTGGIRKLRWAGGGKGKRGGVKVIYYFHSQEMPLYLFTLFAKNERANLSTEEKRTLFTLVRILVMYWRQRR